MDKKGQPSLAAYEACPVAGKTYEAAVRLKMQRMRPMGLSSLGVRGAECSLLPSAGALAAQDVSIAPPTKVNATWP